MHYLSNQPSSTESQELSGRLTPESVLTRVGTRFNWDFYIEQCRAPCGCIGLS